MITNQGPMNFERMAATQQPAGLNAAPDCAKPQRESEITAELNRLRQSITLAVENLAVLVQRLNPVLKAEEPCPAPPENSKPDRILVPLAQFIKEERTKIHSLAAYTAYITSRLEI